MGNPLPPDATLGASQPALGEVPTEQPAPDVPEIPAEPKGGKI